MEPNRVVAILAEIGKAVRVLKYYPPSHPSAQRVMSELAAALPGLARIGTVELRITPNAFVTEGIPLAPRHELLRELAQLLYQQGTRTIVLEPGASAEEVSALVRALLGGGGAAGRKMGVVVKLPVLPHIRLNETLEAAGEATAEELEETAAFSRRSRGEFRPDALPPDIEARRFIESLATTPAEFLLGSVSRLDALAGQLAGERDFGTLAEVLNALAGLAADAPDAQALQAAQHALGDLSVPSIAAGLVARLSNPALTVDEREPVAAALASLGGVAFAALLDAYVTATDPDVKEACEEVTSRTGARALPVLARRSQEERRETRMASAALLGATGCDEAMPLLAPLVRDADWTVRRAAVSALGRLGGVEAGRAAIAALQDAEGGVRAAAAEAVGRRGDLAAVPELLARLAEEDSDDVISSIALALGVLRDGSAVPKLAQLARFVSGVFQRRAVAVRVAAVHALATIGTPEARAALEQLRDDRVPEIRAAVLQALG